MRRGALAALALAGCVGAVARRDAVDANAPGAADASPPSAADASPPSAADAPAPADAGLAAAPDAPPPADLRPWAPEDDPRAIGIPAAEASRRLQRLLWPMAATAPALPERPTFGDVARLARRMLADDRARPGVAAFFRWWLGLERLAAPDLVRETELFGTAVVLDDDARLRTLLEAPYTLVNGAIAPYYGMSGVSGDAFRRVGLDPKQRGGILTRLAFLTLNGGASARGVAVLDRVLTCDLEFPKPPDRHAPSLDGVPGATTRARLQNAVQSPQCIACHQLIDPFGFTFEHYDRAGRWRDSEAGVAVDASAAVDGRLTGDVFRFSDAIDLGRQLAGLPAVARCMTRRWFRFALGRQEDDGDEAEIAAAFDAFRASGLDLRTLIVAVASSAPFLAR